jgi:hypothetical protein
VNASDTLSGTDGVATLNLPDGTQTPVLARKVPRGDGSFGWAVIDDSVIAFEERFAGTDMKPADHLPANTAVLTKKPVPTTITVDETTKRLVSADLIQFLGDPDRILAQKGLDPERLAHLKAHPASVTMARRLCTLAGSKWQSVLQYIPMFYPETK